MVLKKGRFKDQELPLDEAQICRILVNRAIIERILYRNRKEGFYGVFRIMSSKKEEKRSSF